MNKTINNVVLRIVGILLIVPAIILSYFVPEPKVEQPWVRGLFKNIWHAYGKYDSRSWVRRLVFAMKNPEIVGQYWGILANKQEVEYVGYIHMGVKALTPMHDVQTDHQHHRRRVAMYRQGHQPASKYGDVVVVDGFIHDGHHRIAALKEAGVSSVLVKYYISMS